MSVVASALAGEAAGALPQPLFDTPPDPGFVEQPVRARTLAAFRQALASGEIGTMAATDLGFSADRLVTLAEHDRFGLPFAAKLCLDTGLIVTDPALSPATIERYYRDFYHPMHFGVADIGEVGSLYRADQGAKVWGWLSPHLPARDGAPVTVCEVGAGLGNVLAGLREAAARQGVTLAVTGTEYSEECRRVAGERGVPLIAGGLPEVAALDQRFDVLVLSHVFEHFVHLDRELALIREVLAPDGLLFIEVPGVRSLHRRVEYGFDFIRYFTHAHIYNFALDPLRAVVEPAGFRLIAGDEECHALFAPVPGMAPSLPCRDAGAGSLPGYLQWLREEQAGLHALAQRFAELRQDNSRLSRQLEAKAALAERQAAILRSPTRLARHVAERGWVHLRRLFIPRQP